MPADAPTILATSGGYALNPEGRRRLDLAPLVHHAVELSGVSGRRPRICHLGTAGGDQRCVRGRARRGGPGGGVRPVTPASVLDAQRRGRRGAPARAGRRLGRRRVGGEPARGVAGARARRGASPGLGGRRRARRRRARARSAGTSAAPPTRSAPTCAPVTNGLALLPYGNGVHYDSEARRRPLVHRLVADGDAAADALHGRRRRAASTAARSSSRPSASGAARAPTSSGATSSGAAVEERIEPRRLPGRLTVAARSVIRHVAHGHRALARAPSVGLVVALRELARRPDPRRAGRTPTARTATARRWCRAARRTPR